MKHRLFTCVFMFFACLTVVGQVNQVWWSKGRVLHVNPVAGIDSVTYGQFVNADTFLIVIDRASRRIIYDTVNTHIPGIIFHDTIHTTHTVYLEPGRRIGVFSVAKDKQVSFSQGNLQYIQNQNIWKFADQQYEYIGARNVKDGELANKIDLFGWSGDNVTAPFGVSISANNDTYAGEFVDWGVNEIQGDEPNTWRTLSKAEWEYLLNGRPNSNKLRCRAQINGTKGFVFLPDNWVLPSGIELNLEVTETNIFTIDQWSTMENAGAVFLPAAGRRRGVELIYLNDHGNYWSSTRRNSNYAEYLAFTFSTNKLYVDAQLEINLGRSVRLVHDTIVPPPAPCETFEVNGVKFNMMCVEGGTFMMGAGSDAHQVTLSDYHIGETEVTQGLWKAVMGGELPPRQEIMGDEYPVADISMVDCRRFVERLTELTGRHFRIPTEAEWEYAARGGVKSKGYKYAGSDDINVVAIWKGTVRLDENGKEIYAPEPVMTRKPNELGIYDMSGNLAEWVNDWNGEFNLYPQINPTGPTTYTTTYSHRVHYRGGCWTFPEYKCEVTFKQPKNVPSITDPNRGFNGIGLRLVLSDEEPFKMVYLNDSTRIVLRPVKGEKYDYYIGETEVTYALWKAVMGTVLGVEETDNKPVSRVSWDDCQKFIAKLNELTGLHFRLPTEAEWEYAARGGSRSNGYMFAGSNDIDSVGWYMINSDSTDHCVAQLMSNELGIYDMTGNVWEWCQDYYDVNQTMHVVKSGSWFDAATACRIDARTGRAANYKSFIGFRIVLDAHQYVDLGLSVKWATFNLGASAPEEYGDYFAWGETEPKEIYSWATYKLCNGTSSSLTKYCSDGNYGNADYKTTLEPEDDAAYVNWGGNWRMPTEAEWIELRQKCTWKKTTINGFTGYRVTAKNGNSIFLPRAGLRMNKVEYAVDSVGYYASSTHIPNFQKEDYAYYMLMYNNAIGRSSAVRYYGLTIRPVYDDVPDPCMVVKVNDTLSINMMRVEGGTFMMGAMEGDTRANANEKPAHEVTLTYDYYMGQTEVTQGLWKAVMGSDNNPSTMKGDDLPVNNVLWEDAQEFVYKLSQMTGLSFDLPTEAEWQFAARGGNRSKGYLYAGSDNADDVAWYSSNSGGVIHTVATKQSNELGIYDMSGNVFEWCSDWLAPYSAEAQVDPKGPISGEYHVYCGGGWYLGTVHCRSSHRRQTTAGYTEAALGFRVVLREKVEPEYVDFGLSNRGIMIEKFIILYKKELFNL